MGWPFFEGIMGGTRGDLYPCVLGKKGLDVFSNPFDSLAERS